VHESGDRLLRLLDNVLQYSKIAADDLEVDAQPFALGSLLAGLETLYLPLAAGRGVEFRAEAVPDSLPAVEGDPVLLQRVLTLLLDNALEAAAGGRVTLRAAARRRDRAWTVRFEVCDTGPGIDPDDAQRIFEPFQQADGSTRRERQGVGLGLSIARGLVGRMGGRLTLDSRADRDTCFAVEIVLPAADAEREANGHGSDAFDDALACVREARPRVLLVEDPDDPPTVLFRTLTLLGARVEIVAGGSIAGRGIDGKRYDVVIVDDAVLSAFGSDALDLADDVDLVLRTSNGQGDAPPSGFRAVLREPVDLVSLADVLATV
jgi:anti-sigma regulatory factor (Ser/Thr protein kinase)/CheY-like chemotaxis protein